MDGVRPVRGASLWRLHALGAVVARVALGCPAHSEPSSPRAGQNLKGDAFPRAGNGPARLTWRFGVWARGRGPLEQRQAVAASQPSATHGLMGRLPRGA